MSWLSDHYKMDGHGNFYSKEEYEKAVKNGDLREVSGGAYDSETGNRYDDRGNRR